MLPDETDIQCLTRRCNEFERRIAALEDNEVVAKTATNSAIRPFPYQIVERYADNGVLSHYELIKVATGTTSTVVWSQPE